MVGQPKTMEEVYRVTGEAAEQLVQPPEPPQEPAAEDAAADGNPYATNYTPGKLSTGHFEDNEFQKIMREYKERQLNEEEITLEKLLED